MGIFPTGAEKNQVANYCTQISGKRCFFWGDSEVVEAQFLEILWVAILGNFFIQWDWDLIKCLLRAAWVSGCLTIRPEILGHCWDRLLSDFIANFVEQIRLIRLASTLSKKKALLSCRNHTFRPETVGSVWGSALGSHHFHPWPLLRPCIFLRLWWKSLGSDSAHDLCNGPRVCLSADAADTTDTTGLCLSNCFEVTFQCRNVLNRQKNADTLWLWLTVCHGKIHHF